MPKNDDKEARRLQRANERDEIQTIRDSMNLNLAANPDRFYEIIKGTYKAPTIDGESSRITASVNVDAFRKNANKKVTIPEDAEDIDPIRTFKSTSTTNVSTKYAQVIERLERFPFSEDDTKLKKQMIVVESALRTAMYDIIMEEVFANTKKAFKQYVKGGNKVAGGLQVRYQYGDRTIYVTAKGNFFGDEAVCVSAVDGKLKAAVLQVFDDGAVNDLSDQYDLLIQEGK